MQSLIFFTNNEMNYFFFIGVIQLSKGGKLYINKLIFAFFKAKTEWVTPLKVLHRQY